MTDQNPETMSKEQLIAYCFDLEQRLQDLLPAEDPVQNLRKAFNLSPQRARILAALSHGTLLTREAMFSVSRGRNDKMDADLKAMDVHIWAIRKAVNSYGVEIENVWGTGYQLVAGKEVVKAAMKGKEVYA